MNKNNFLNQKLLSKSNIAIIIALMMLLGFLVSRPMNALGTVFFGVNALRGVHPKKWLQQKWWLLGLLWIAFYYVSYFWSKDIHSWHERIDTKLPFLLLPLAFAYLPRFSARQLQLFTVVAAIMFLIGAGYSTSFFFTDPPHYLKGYYQSRLLPTPVENDHICFSMGVAAFIAWSVYTFPYLLSKAAKWFIGIVSVLLAVYLHILSAKSGLLAWYVFVLGWGIYLGMRKNKWLGVGIIGGVVLFALLAINYIPTLKGRVWYVEHTYKLYKAGDKTGDYSDMGRVISYKVAAKVIKQHPLMGVGAGDILEEMKAGYDRWFPQIKETQRLFPHNQFLTIAVGCGIPAMLFFLVWLVYPLFGLKRDRSSFFFLITWFMWLIPIMVEPFLEIQFGVYVFLFFLLWQRHMSIAEPATDS